jgi:hypothetical protein
LLGRYYRVLLRTTVTSLLCFFVNFGTPRPQPLPLSQAPVHKVTDLNNRSAVCNKVPFKSTIQKYHFGGPWPELIYKIASIPLIRCNLMASNIHMLIHIIETTMCRTRSPYEGLLGLRSFNREGGQKSRKSPHRETFPCIKQQYFCFVLFFFFEVTNLKTKLPISWRPSTSMLLKYGRLNTFRLYTSDNVLMNMTHTGPCAWKGAWGIWASQKIWTECEAGTMLFTSIFHDVMTFMNCHNVYVDLQNGHANFQIRVRKGERGMWPLWVDGDKFFLFF